MHPFQATRHPSPEDNRNGVVQHPVRMLAVCDILTSLLFHIQPIWVPIHLATEIKPQVSIDIVPITLLLFLL